VLFTVACVAAARAGRAVGPAPARARGRVTRPAARWTSPSSARLLETWGQPVVTRTAGAARRSAASRHAPAGRRLTRWAACRRPMVGHGQEDALLRFHPGHPDHARRTGCWWHLSIPVNTPAEWMAPVRTSPGKYNSIWLVRPSAARAPGHPFESLAAALGLIARHAPLAKRAPAAGGGPRNPEEDQHGDGRSSPRLLVKRVGAGAPETGNVRAPAMPEVPSRLFRALVPTPRPARGIWGPPRVLTRPGKTSTLTFAGRAHRLT
jgi:hypothetical protein